MTRTFRPMSSVAIFCLGALVAGYYVADAVAHTPDQGLRALPAVALGAWALWMIMVRPSIRSDDTGLRITNPGRVTTVPWSQVRSIQRRLQVTISLDDGTDLTCWGSPYVKRGARDAQDVTLLELDAAWHTGRHATTPPGAIVDRHWDASALAAGVVLAAASAVALLL